MGTTETAKHRISSLGMCAMEIMLKRNGIVNSVLSKWNDFSILAGGPGCQILSYLIIANHFKDGILPKGRFHQCKSLEWKLNVHPVLMGCVNSRAVVGGGAGGRVTTQPEGRWRWEPP